MPDYFLLFFFRKRSPELGFFYYFYYFLCCHTNLFANNIDCFNILVYFGAYLVPNKKVLDFIRLVLSISPKDGIYAKFSDAIGEKFWDLYT